MAVDMTTGVVAVNNNNLGEDDDLKNPVFVEIRKSSTDSHPRVDSGFGDVTVDEDVFTDPSRSPPLSPASTIAWATTPQKEQLSPLQQIMRYRSPSQMENELRNHLSRNSDNRPAKQYGTKFVKEFDKFYKQSYLEKQKIQEQRAANPTKQPAPQHFHRPANFSYSKVRTDFKLPKKGDRDYKMPSKGEPYKPVKDQDAIRTAKYPPGHPEANLLPIERDDWPGPPCPAAAFPELFYERAIRQRHRHKSGEKTLDDSTGSAGSTSDQTDGKVEITIVDDESEEEEEIKRDPKTDRELQTLSRLSTSSGAAKVILQEIQKTRVEGVKLDPRSASRTPSASYEPPYSTRYENPVFASPSRDNEYRPRLGSLDNLIMGKKYRNSTLPLSNYPVDRHQLMYETAKNAVPNFQGAPKPGYGLAPKAATLDNRNGADHSFDGIETQARRYRGGSADELQRVHYSSTSSMEEYDPTTGLRRNTKIRGSAVSDKYGESYVGYRRSIPSVYRGEEAPKIYPYEQLLITNPELPPDVERNTIEKHLSKEEFESIFHMSRGEFHRLAEWKRNDLKRRVNLF